MSKVKFWKMSGAGNDFICLDNRAKKLRLTKKKIAAICHRQFGIGADGVLVLEPSPKAGIDFRMRYYNADGGEADMCGNGARCFARFAKSRSGFRKPVMHFLTGAGVVRGEFIKDHVRIGLTLPHDWSLNRNVETSLGAFTVHSVNTGVPHAVLFVDEAEKAPVKDLGRELRFHSAFSPKGTNVNFVQVQDKKKIRVRTYERGVEDETLACGTGVVASVILAHFVKGLASPVKVRVRGGADLTVEFKREGDAITEVRLAGPADFVFQGEIDV